MQEKVCIVCKSTAQDFLGANQLSGLTSVMGQMHCSTMLSKKAPETAFPASGIATLECGKEAGGAEEASREATSASGRCTAGSRLEASGADPTGLSAATGVSTTPTEPSQPPTKRSADSRVCPPCRGYNYSVRDKAA